MILAVIITLAAGGFGIFASLRKKPARGRTGSGRLAVRHGRAPCRAAASPGVVLNGEPVDPDSPKS